MVFADLRRTSRVILLAPSNRILLLFTRVPDSSNWRRWVTPGGGVDEGESHEQAAVRELFEETGFQVDTVGQPVWTETIPLPYDEAIYPAAYQEFFVVRCSEEFEPDRSGWTESEHVDVTQWRWWGVAELESAGEPFEPKQLPSLLSQIIAEREHR